MKFVAETMQRIVEEEIGEAMMERVGIYRNCWQNTCRRTRSQSSSRLFRVDEVTWIDAIVRYLVPPREAGSVKTRLIPKLLAGLNAEPDRVMFPAAANR